MSSFNNSKAKKQVKNLPQNKQFDILVYADYNCTTGFGNVSEQLIKVWKKKIAGVKNISITIFAINDHSEKQYKIAPNITVLPANIAPYASETDLFQMVAFLTLVQNLHFNVIYLLNDLEIVGKFSKDLVLINRDKKKRKLLQHKSIFYFPIDSLPRKEDLAFLDTFDEIITYTKYGENVIKKLAPASVAEKIQVIPHGVDTKTFHKLPLETISPIKEKLFGKDKYVIGTVNRNSARKDLATLMLAFVQLKADLINLPILSEKLVLYMHCNPTDRFGVNLKFLAMKLGLKENKDVFFPSDYSENKGCSSQELNNLYNCMDVFVTTSTAEGWGLTVTEAMATETLVIAPFHTSLIELCWSDELKKHLVLGISPTNLEEVVFVHDGDKVRYKTPVLFLAQKLHLAFGMNVPIIAHQEMIKDAKKSLIQYNWTETAEKFWTIISKYLK